MYLVGLWEGLDVLGKFCFFLMGGYPFLGGESGLAGFGGDFCLGWTEDMTKNGGEYLFQPKSGVELKVESEWNGKLYTSSSWEFTNLHGFLLFLLEENAWFAHSLCLKNHWKKRCNSANLSLDPAILS